MKDNSRASINIYFYLKLRRKLSFTEIYQGPEAGTLLTCLSIGVTQGGLSPEGETGHRAASDVHSLTTR